MSSFVVANCDALRLTRSAMAKEMEAHIAALSEQQQSLLAFATSHKAQVLACVEAVAEDREATNAKLNGVLAAEEAAALKRIAAEEEKAEARAESLQEEGAEFVAQVQALMTAFTAKHAAGSRADAGAAVELARADVAALRDGAAQVLTEGGNSADEVAAEHSSTITSSLDAFASSSSSANEATSTSMSRTLEDAVGRVESMEEGAKAFSAQVTATSQSAQAAAAESVEAISAQAAGVIETVNSAAAELGAESDAAVSGLESAVEAMKESIAAANADVEGVGQTAASLPELVVGVTSKRVASLEAAANAVRDVAEQGKAGVDSQIESETERQAAWSVAHVETVSSLEGTLRAHVEDAAVALAKTNETPIKQAFERPNGLSKTRSHDLIVAEALDMSEAPEEAEDAVEEATAEAEAEAGADEAVVETPAVEVEAEAAGVEEAGDGAVAAEVEEDNKSEAPAPAPRASVESTTSTSSGADEENAENEPEPAPATRPARATRTRSTRGASKLAPKGSVATKAKRASAAASGKDVETVVNPLGASNRV